MHLSAIFSQMYLSSPASNTKIQAYVSSCLPETSTQMSKEQPCMFKTELLTFNLSNLFHPQTSPPQLMPTPLFRLLRLKTCILILIFIILKTWSIICSHVSSALPSKLVCHFHSGPMVQSTTIWITF